MPSVAALVVAGPVKKRHETTVVWFAGMCGVEAKERRVY